MSQVEMKSQFAIENPPKDGITRVGFSKNGECLLVSSWDKSVTLYGIDIENNSSKEILSYTHNTPVLDCMLTPDDATIYSGGCDNIIYESDVNKGIIRRILCSENQIEDKDKDKDKDNDNENNHNQPIRCLEYEQDYRCIISGSWDKTIKVWDPRKKNPLILTQHLPSKVFAMSTSIHRLIVGCSGQQIYIYDLRNMKEPEQKRESPLKHQIRAISGHPNGEQFIIGSIEGRVAIEYFDRSPIVQSKKFAFKCHRHIDPSTSIQTIYPVNCLAVHPIYGTFATGGCDGMVNIWDMDNKKRICQFPPYGTSISSMDFSATPQHQLLAIAQSYTWEQGPSSPAKDSIFIRKLNDNEIKPKQKKATN